jgi:hypothetical protein
METSAPKRCKFRSPVRKQHSEEGDGEGEEPRRGCFGGAGTLGSGSGGTGAMGDKALVISVAAMLCLAGRKRKGITATETV